MDEQVELDALVAHVLLGDFGIEDGDLGDRALGLEDGGEQGDEDALTLGTAEQELKDDVEGGVEGLRESNPRARMRRAKSQGNLGGRVAGRHLARGRSGSGWVEIFEELDEVAGATGESGGRQGERGETTEGTEGDGRVRSCSCSVSWRIWAEGETSTRN